MSWQLRNSLAALRHRNFRLFVIGQFISVVGFWMQSVGQSWLVYRLTGSPAYLGAIAFAQQVPILLFAFAAGGIIDRMNRRRIILLTQSLALLQAAILAFLTYTGRISIGSLFILAAFLGAVSSFDMPARQAFLVQMVGREDLMNAIAINSSLFNGARMLGPALAGIIVAKWGEALCFFLNAVSYLAVLLSLLIMKIPGQPQTYQKQSLKKDLLDGFRFIQKTRPVRVMLQLVGALGAGGFSYAVLLPIFADRILGKGAAGLGWLTAATGTGALMGAIFLAGRKGIHGIGRIISISAFGFSTMLILFGLSRIFWLSLLLICGLGSFMMMTVASINTSIQSIIPDSLRGRIMSFFTTMLIGTAPIGALLAGAIAKYAGVRPTVVLLGCVCMVSSIWFYKSLPEITPEARRLYLIQNPPMEDTSPTHVATMTSEEAR
jgi:MFS family permease